MTKAELIRRLAERTGLSDAAAVAAVEALFAVDGGIIAEGVAGGGPVQIGEFGTFVPAMRSGPGRARRGGDDEGGPPAAPVFHPGSGWRQRVRGGRKAPRGTGSTGPRRGGDGGTPGTGGLR